MKHLTLEKIKNKFKFEVLSGEDKLDKKIEVYGFNRAGLELTGYFQKGAKARRIILLSTKEYDYMKQFDAKERTERYTKLLDSNTPGMIITSRFKDNILIELAKTADFPILIANIESTSDFIQKLLEYMDDFFAPSTEEHATLINVFGKGVLITGESGIGKSELAMDLIKKNHLFIGDDRIVITRKNNKLYGRSHEILKNLVEVRGIGVVDISQTNGYQSIMDETPIDLIVYLSMFKKDGVDDSERLGNEFDERVLLDVRVPLIKIPVSSGRNIASILEIAVSKLKIFENGLNIDISEFLEKRINKYNKENDEQ